LSFHVENLRLLILYPSAAIGLYAYSSVLKRKPLVGHLLIATYCAGVALVVWLSELPAFLSLSKVDVAAAFYLKQITICYAIFAFLSTLLRELIKVLQDEKGDRQAAYQTTVIVWGQEKVKRLCTGLSITLLILLSLSGFYFSNHFNSLSVILALLLLALPVILIIYGLNRANTPPNFKQLSRLTKLLMLLGVLALLSFS
jgi:4-hydroxybenzoate polyprenyltransferase